MNEYSSKDPTHLLQLKSLLHQKKFAPASHCIKADKKTRDALAQGSVAEEDVPTLL